MSHVLIRPAGGYTDHAAIKTVIREALQLDDSIAAMLAEHDERRLVVIKPNWIQEGHQQHRNTWVSVITHPNVVLAAAEAVAEAMGGTGTIAVCDAPHTHADFEGIVARGGLFDALQKLRGRFPRLQLELIDLRRERWITRDDVIVERIPNPPDPRGYTKLDMGRASLFHGHPGEGRYYGADYDTRVVNEHHRGDVQEYLIAGTPMACDLFINLPKLKTHKKTGITCCLKNLVGINGDKNWLPHHTVGAPATGGDEFPQDTSNTRLERFFKHIGTRMALGFPAAGAWLYARMRRAGMRAFGDSEYVVRNGNWYGNDTCWRMALDLNRALLYGDKSGNWRKPLTRRPYLAIVDGIVGGEGNGPVSPTPVDAGVLVAGTNPAAIDAVAARLMGYAPERIPLVRHAFDEHHLPVSDISLDEVRAHDARCGAVVSVQDVEAAVAGGFKPHFGWQHALEAQ